MHVVCKYNNNYNNICISGEFCVANDDDNNNNNNTYTRGYTRGLYNAGDGQRAPRSGESGNGARRGLVQRGPLPSVTARNDNNKMRRVRSNVRPRRRPADPSPPPRHTRTDRVRRAILLRATAANRSFSYTNPEHSRNHLSALLYYYYHYTTL